MDCGRVYIETVVWLGDGEVRKRRILGNYVYSGKREDGVLVCIDSCMPRRSETFVE
jgi:hypothetical protein